MKECPGNELFKRKRGRPQKNLVEYESEIAKAASGVCSSEKLLKLKQNLSACKSRRKNREKNGKLKDKLDCLEKRNMYLEAVFEANERKIRALRVNLSQLLSKSEER